MKKTVLSLAVAAFAAGSLSLASCGGNKAEASAEAKESTETNETAAAVESDVTKISDAQKSALVASTLVSEEDFAKPVFIDCNATWCGTCRQFAPFFEASAAKYADRAKFVPVDIDVYGEVANAFGVQSIPTVIAILPSGEYVTYVGSQDIIGDGVFDAIVEGFIK